MENKGLTGGRTQEGFLREVERAARNPRPLARRGYPHYERRYCRDGDRWDGRGAYRLVLSDLSAEADFEFPLPLAAMPDGSELLHTDDDCLLTAPDGEADAPVEVAWRVLIENEPLLRELLVGDEALEQYGLETTCGLAELRCHVSAGRIRFASRQGRLSCRFRAELWTSPRGSTSPAGRWKDTHRSDRVGRR